MIKKLNWRLIAAALVFASATVATAEGIVRPKIANRNIYKNSDILLSQNSHTVLPKNCVLHVPDTMKHKMGSNPKGGFLLWPKFYAQNYGWLVKKEVSLDHASGKKVFTEEELKRFKQSNKLVIAVHKNNPISVRKAAQPTSKK